MTWTPDPEAFLADLEAKPTVLRAFARDVASEPWPVDPGATRRVVFLGMGSSRFAASVVAGRLRARGVDAVSEYASAEAGAPGGPGTLAIGVSAGGATPETAAALARHAAEGSITLALTNVVGSAIGAHAVHQVALLAGEERGGVACRTYQHTMLRLLQLEAQLAGERSGEIAGLARRTAEATEDLLTRREAWMEAATEILTGTGSVFCIAPIERLGSAEQGALTFREGPRIAADACETGDWLHVDVYLTLPLAYRAVLFAGSRFDDDVMIWMRERAARVLAVGREADGAAHVVRYRGDDDRDVALCAEILVCELAAAARWRQG
jgi:fructoselysine-6-P-deglycase FrlB-like protein